MANKGKNPEASRANRFAEHLIEEASADRLLFVTPRVIPGPLQTPDYFRALIAFKGRTGAGMQLPQERVEELIKSRAQRLEAIKQNGMSGRQIAFYIGTEALSGAILHDNLQLPIRSVRQQQERLVEVAGWRGVDMTMFRTPPAPLSLPTIEGHDERFYLELPHGMVRVPDDDLAAVEATLNDVRNLALATGPQDIAFHLDVSRLGT